MYLHGNYFIMNDQVKTKSTYSFNEILSMLPLLGYYEFTILSYLLNDEKEHFTLLELNYLKLCINSFYLKN